MTDEEIRQELRKRKRQQRTRKRLIAVCVAAVLTVTAGYFAGSAIGSKIYENKLSKMVSVTADKPLVKTAMRELGNKGGEKFWSWFG